MFSGMIEAVGEVRVVRRAAGGGVIEVAAELTGESLVGGESVAVAGVCLTVEPLSGGFFAALSPETMRRTTLGALGAGSPVNLERSLRLGARLGGHLVLGHVDATTTVLAMRADGEFRVARLATPPALAREIATQGSIAIDGVSLTVATVVDGSFEVALVPATLAATTLADVQVGRRVNLETDVLAKYVHRVIEAPGERLARLWEDFGHAAD